MKRVSEIAVHISLYPQASSISNQKACVKVILDFLSDSMAILILFPDDGAVRSVRNVLTLGALFAPFTGHQFALSPS